MTMKIWDVAGTLFPVAPHLTLVPSSRPTKIPFDVGALL